MDRPIHIGNVPRRVALLAVLVASCGCNGAFHRRGIPPEPKVTREDAPVQFNSDPNPMGPAMAAPAMTPGRAPGTNTYGPGGAYGGDTTPPLGEPVGPAPSPSPAIETPPPATNGGTPAPEPFGGPSP